MKVIAVFLGFVLFTMQALAAHVAEEKPVFVKAILKIHGETLSTAMTLESNSSGSVENLNYKMVLTPLLREGKMIEISADILEKREGGLRRVSTPKVITMSGQEATISGSQGGKQTFRLSVEPLVE